MSVLRFPRITACSTALPADSFGQERVRDIFYERVLGPGWEKRPELAESVDRIDHLFASTQVECRQFVVDPMQYYGEPRSTADRMTSYEEHAYPLARTALSAGLASINHGGASSVTDFIVVSCTGYVAPGLDILLARDLGMRPDVRRVVIGHMGCYGALVGLRSALQLLRGQDTGLVALLCVELCSLHCSATLDTQAVTSFALFGDAAACALISSDPETTGPELVDTYSTSDFGAMEQMSWRITDQGFVMGLSPRVPVTLGRTVGSALERLLRPHGLDVSDIDHWLIHPGGPSILQAVQRRLGLREDAVALSWQVLRENGNCSSPTVLMILDRLLRSDRAQPGDWGVMLAFGPGLTIETCLLRF